MNLHDLRIALRWAKSAHVTGWVVYKANDGITDVIRDLNTGAVFATSDTVKSEAWIQRTFYKPGDPSPRITHRLLLSRRGGRIALSDGNQIDLETGEFGTLAPLSAKVLAGSRVVGFGDSPGREVA